MKFYQELIRELDPKAGGGMTEREWTTAERLAYGEKHFGPMHYCPDGHYNRVCDGLMPSRATREPAEVTCDGCKAWLAADPSERPDLNDVMLASLWL